MDIQISVKNLGSVIRYMETRPAAIAAAIKGAMYASAYLVEREGKIALTSGPTRAIRTGRLRESTKVQRLTDVQAKIYPTVNYAIFVHQGTRYMRPRPFMAVAARRAKGMVKSLFEQAIKKAIQ